MRAQRPLTISTTPRQPDKSSSLRSMKFARGNQDSNVPRRERVRGFNGLEDCVRAEIAAGGSTQSSSSSTGERDPLTIATYALGNEAGNTNDDALERPDRSDRGGGSVVNASPSSSTSASSPASVSSTAPSSSSSSLMLMKFCWRGFRGIRPGTRECPSRQARALERSALRL